MKRLILIHGYVEDSGIFDQVVPLLPPGELVRISIENEFDRWPASTPINGYTLAAFLVKEYAITTGDVVIGHSMGGWIAIHIKNLTGATAIQLSSFTNQRKVVTPVYNLGIIRFLANSGVLQSRPAVNYVKRKYPFQESRSLNYSLVDRLMGMRRAYISWQLSVLFASVPPLTVEPDLRIHARTDNIVSPPDEPYAIVPGDHFALVFHPAEVAKPIRELFVEKGFLTPTSPALPS